MSVGQDFLRALRLSYIGIIEPGLRTFLHFNLLLSEEQKRKA
jgi:hypothetical protein